MKKSYRSISTILALAMAQSLLMAGHSAMAADDAGIQLGAQQLYQGFEARKVLLSADGQKLALDARVFKVGKEKEGRIVTDPIDLGPAQGLLGLPAEVKSVDIEINADTPEGSSVTLEARTSATKLETAGWSDWAKLAGLKATLDTLGGRYIQIKLTLKAANPTNCPAVSQLVLKPRTVPAPVTGWKPLKVAASSIQEIVRSPINFIYERPDTPRLAAFRKEAKLDEVVAGAKDDFEKLTRLMDWVGSCYNLRGTKRETSPGWYAWDLDKVFSIENGTNQIAGHCMSYAEVLVSAATAMGYVSARHYSIRGFRDMTHEVTDIWVPSLGKWVYFDPSLSNQYFDKQTKTWLNIIEIHKIVVSTYPPEDMDLDSFCARSNDGAKASVKKIGGQSAIGCRLGPWKYGAPMPANYDWGWSHGYLATCFVQMTPRNDFHSNPDKVSKRFQSPPGYDGFPNWVDEKTPPIRRGENWFTRMRDFYWTLDQASVNLVRSADGKSVQVQLGQSMPFFKSYQLKVNDTAVPTVANPFTWELKPGQNKLEVAPVDEFGKVGLASSVTLEYGP